MCDIPIYMSSSTHMKSQDKLAMQEQVKAKDKRINQLEEAKYRCKISKVSSVLDLWWFYVDHIVANKLLRISKWTLSFRAKYKHINQFEEAKIGGNSQKSAVQFGIFTFKQELFMFCLFGKRQAQQSPSGGQPQADILKSLPAAKSTFSNDYRSDFWEIPPDLRKRTRPWRANSRNCNAKMLSVGQNRRKARCHMQSTPILPTPARIRDSLRVAACCSVLQRVAACCSVLHSVAACCSVLQHVAACCSVLQCVAACCSMLQCVAMFCCDALCVSHTWDYSNDACKSLFCQRRGGFESCIVRCSMLQCVAVRCSHVFCMSHTGDDSDMILARAYSVNAGEDERESASCSVLQCVARIGEGEILQCRSSVCV